MAADAVPERMTAVAIAEPGGPAVLTPETRAVPRPGPGEVLIAVAAAGVNRPDVLQRQGRYPPPKGASDLPGLEVAGRIAALGAGVTRWREGDAVTALLTGGGYAAYAVADAGVCLPVPGGLSFAEAAALPETVFTVYHNVIERGGLRAGESLLVHGGASGIGLTAIQLARAWGASAYATTRDPAKRAICTEMGATRAIAVGEEDFVRVVKDATGGGADVALDIVGGSYIQPTLKALAPDGRLVFLAFLEDATASVNFGPVLLKRLTLTGSTLRGREVAFKTRLAEAVRRDVWPLVESGALTVRVHGEYPLQRAAEAHAEMEASRHAGKLVLRPEV